MKKTDKKVLFAPLTVVAMLLLLLLFDIFNITDADSAPEILLRIIAVQVLVFVMTALFYAFAMKVRFVKNTALRPFAPSRIALIITLLGVMVTGSFLISVASNLILGSEGSTSATTELYGAISAEGGALLTVLAVCVIPALCEEFAFRGVLLSQLRHCRAFPACLVCALLFATVHFDLHNFVSNVFCGLVLGWLVMVTRSLIASMVLHALYNVTVLFALPYIWRVTLEPMGTLFAIFLLAGLFLLCLGASLGEAQAIYNEYALELPPDSGENGKSKMSVWRGAANLAKSPGIWVCIVIFVLAVTLS